LASGQDLSGTWDGLYSYPRTLPSVSFVAVLNETAGWLTGTTQEAAQGGSAGGQKLTATLQGRRSGAFVKFLKLYDVPVPGYDSIAYEGNVSADGTEIAGRWIALVNWSGTFLMIRSRGLVESSSKTAKERLGAAV
jgi:hypothetical protein